MARFPRATHLGKANGSATKCRPKRDLKAKVMKTLEIGWSSSKKYGKLLDFLVSAKSLLTELERRGMDVVPRLGAASIPVDFKTRDLLLLTCRGDMPSGRVALYICPLCGDYGCGVVSAKIYRENSSFIWSDFAWETNYENKLYYLEKLGPFRFVEGQYRDALAVRSVD
jgi:hypothetical protein